MASSKLQIDERARQLTCNGRATVLQEKTWQVFELLRRRSPAIVERREIIDALWQGNWLTGEKGLNQAIWTLRQALGDDARAPAFIRTIPRRGYQWIYIAASAKTSASETSSRTFVLRLAAGLAVVAGGLTLLSMRAAPLHDYAEPPPPQRITRAYLVNRDIHVELDGGCLGILKNANNAEISEPVVSADGREVAVAVHEPGGCRLVTIDVTSGTKRDFGSCPAG
ncbi:MAG: winged helix-turn-helix domain-containing protein [Pseudomonadota bacterium]